MRIDRGNRSTRRKPAPAPLCPPQIPHDLTPGSNPGRRGGNPATNRLSYGTVLHIITIVLYECETWSLTLKGRRVSENRVLRRMFGPKRNEMIGGWRKLHNDIHNSYF
jgi:hypothetical protein